MSAATTHAVPIVVQPADIDFMGHANNASYLHWVQDAIVGHWERWATREAVAAYLWVAVKHEITYVKPALVREELVVTVTLERVRRESAFYQTVIRRGDQVLTRVHSRWCCLDALSLRPTRLAQDVIDRFVSGDNGVGAP